MRVKSQWFKPGAPRSPEQQAGAMGFIVWRTARHLLQRMREAGFDIDAGPAYFVFLREVVVFLIAVADRIAHVRLDAAGRAAFTTTLVRHCADTYADSALDLIGPPGDGAASHAEVLIDAANEIVGHYAEFGADPRASDATTGFTPDFAFVRYFGSRLVATVPPKDERWVLDQVMAIEAPEAIGIVQSAMRNLLSTEPRRARRNTMSGE